MITVAPKIERTPFPQCMSPIATLFDLKAPGRNVVLEARAEVR
jgi:hypothetical protein